VSVRIEAADAAAATGALEEGTRMESGRRRVHGTDGGDLGDGSLRRSSRRRRRRRSRPTAHPSIPVLRNLHHPVRWFLGFGGPRGRPVGLDLRQTVCMDPMPTLHAPNQRRKLDRFVAKTTLQDVHLTFIASEALTALHVMVLILLVVHQHLLLMIVQHHHHCQ